MLAGRVNSRRYRPIIIRCILRQSPFLVGGVAVLAADAPKLSEALHVLAERERLTEEVARLKRLAEDLGRRLAQRTAELEAANDELRNEAAERQRAEVALQARDLESRQILDNIPALVAVATATADLEFVNRQILEYTGRAFEEHVNWRTSDLIHPEDLAGVIAGLQQALSTGEPWWLEHRLRRFDGVYRWFESRGRPLRDADGRVVRWCHTLLDIDDRKRARRTCDVTKHTSPKASASA